MWGLWVSAWLREWRAECHFRVNMLEDSSWKTLVQLGAGCLCFLRSPFPVALSVHPKCPWSRASRRIHRQSSFLGFSYCMGLGRGRPSDTAAAGLHSPDSVLQRDSLSALEDAGTLQTAPERSTKSDCTIKRTQRDEWEGPSFWCLTSSEPFPNGVSACIIYGLFLCPCGLSLISPAVRFGRQRVPQRRPR